MSHGNTIARNKKASFNYFLEKDYEAGIILKPSEVKSVRAKQISIEESYVIFQERELYIIKCYIGKYAHARLDNFDPYRKRKLLLHKKELNSLYGKLKTKGYCIIPSLVYLNKRNFVKVKINLAKGKKLHDKRQTIKKREWERRKKQL